METRSITEGALMAALTAILAMAGLFIPLLLPLVMMIETLPVVVICLRWGMRPGAATLAVAGVIIMTLASPLNAIDMLLRSGAPALLLGLGFRRRWKTERTLLFIAIAAFAGLVISIVGSSLIMGISIPEVLSIDQAMIDEMVKLFVDNGFLAAGNVTIAELKVIVTDIFAIIAYLLPSLLLVSGFITAITNYTAANLILRRLKIELPPVTRLATFRLPFGFVFVFILGLGLRVIGDMLWPGGTVAKVGENINLVCLALYFFEGLGLFFYLMEKAPQNMQGVLRFALLSTFIFFFVFVIRIVPYLGVADAIFDFRKLYFLSKKQ
jgi:uncharacterized protein YybS (DUF2232 family)